MSYGYNGARNPFDERDQSQGRYDPSPNRGAYNAPSRGYNGAQQQQYMPPQQAGYGGNSRYNNGPSMGRNDYNGQNVEMEPLRNNGSQFGLAQDPNQILNDCREIDRGIDSIERNLEQLKMLQQRSLDDPDSSLQSSTNRQLDALSSETMTLYRNFAARLKAIKQQPESGSPKNAPQVGKVDRKLKQAINQYQNVESDFRRKLQTQMARQYRIVRPEASEQEVREAVEDTSNQQVFSQALLQSDRRGQSRQALSNVQNRHEAIQKIESQMIELAQLFQDMEELVVQQEAAVGVIEQKGEEVQENLNKGTEQMGVAIKSARARNRKKWWCLLIVVIIIIVIVIVIVITQVVNKGVKKRDIIYNSQGLPITASAKWLMDRAVEARAEVEQRALEWTG